MAEEGSQARWKVWEPQESSADRPLQLVTWSLARGTR